MNLNPFHTHIILKDGSKVCIWSDNVDERTMHVFSPNERFNAESTYCKIISYDKVDFKASNREE